MMAHALLHARLLFHTATPTPLYSENGEKSNGIKNNTGSSLRELDDVTSAETRTERRIILHVDTTDMRPPMVLLN